MEGQVNLKDNLDSIGVTANLEHIDFKKLNLGDYDIQLKTKLNIKTRGLSLDKMVGNATFYNSGLIYKNKNIDIDTLELHSAKYYKNRTFELKSDLVNLTTVGDFEFSEIYDDLFMFWDEYKLYFQHDDKETDKYYAKKLKQIHNHYKVTYDVTFKNFNPVFDLFLPGMYISKNTNLKNFQFPKNLNANLAHHNQNDLYM